MLNTSMIVMAVSVVVTLALVTYLDYVAKKTDSMVVKADSLHYKTDVYTNIAVLISLFAVWFFKAEIIDVLIGGAISLFIIYSAFGLISEGVMILLDKALDKELVIQIEDILNNEKDLTSWHYLKTRQAGNDIFVDVHLVFNCLISLMEAHRIGDRVEMKIAKLDENKNWIINIHLDPYDDSIINSSTLGCNINKQE